MVTQQPAVAEDGLASLEQPQARPETHRIVHEDRLAELPLQPLNNRHRSPVTARHDDGLRRWSVGAASKIVGGLRGDAAKLDRGDEAYDFAVNDLKTARLHERDHRLVHGLAPGCSNRDLCD